MLTNIKLHSLFLFQLDTLLFSFFTFTIFLYMFRTGWSIIRRIKRLITRAASGTVPCNMSFSYYRGSRVVATYFDRDIFWCQSFYFACFVVPDGCVYLVQLHQYKNNKLKIAQDKRSHLVQQNMQNKRADTKIYLYQSKWQQHENLYNLKNSCYRGRCQRLHV